MYLPLSRIKFNPLSNSKLFGSIIRTRYPTQALSTMAAASSPFTLPADFLSGPGPEKVVRKLDFKQTSLPEYDGLYAVVIDNCLTKEECNELIRAAEATTNGNLWEQALVNVGNGRQRLITDVRDCGRIIWDDRDVVAKIWSRVKDCVLPDIEYIKDKAKVTGFGPVKRGEVLQMTRLNERMRFLRYESGQYFRRKCLFFFFLLFSSLCVKEQRPPRQPYLLQTSPDTSKNVLYVHTYIKYLKYTKC